MSCSASGLGVEPVPVEAGGAGVDSDWSNTTTVVTTAAITTTRNTTVAQPAPSVLTSIGASPELGVRGCRWRWVEDDQSAHRCPGLSAVGIDDGWGACRPHGGESVQAQ